MFKIKKCLYSLSIDILNWSRYNALQAGPIAQLGERFNGIEEVKGSSPFRSKAGLPPLSFPTAADVNLQKRCDYIVIDHQSSLVGSVRKATVVGNSKRNEPDSLGNRLRGILEELDRLINPQQPKRTPVPVPIPVRVPRPNQRNPYGR
jgi:hypothetical protein